jgi:hypothetical protein
LNSILLAFLLYAAAGKLRLTRGYSRTVRGSTATTPGSPAGPRRRGRDLT